jgi:transcription initiation factor TFIIB
MISNLSLKELTNNKINFNRFFEKFLEESTENIKLSAVELNDNITDGNHPSTDDELKLKHDIDVFDGTINIEPQLLSKEQYSMESLKTRTLKNINDMLLQSSSNEKDLVCTSCKSTDVISKSGYIVCTSCGTTMDGIIDDNQEWRYYGADDTKSSDPTRCGLPTNHLLPISSLGSTVSYSGNESYKMKKIRTFHKWNAMPYKEKTLYDSFDTINLRATNAGIPQCIVEEAKNIYSKIYELSISRDINRLAIQAACLMAACKMKKVPRNCSEMSQIFQISLSKMRKGAKKFEEIWKIIERRDGYEKKLNLYSTNPLDYLHRFCSKLDLSDEIYEVCCEVCKISEEKGVMGNHISTSRGAGIIYFVASHCGLNITRDDIFKACDISQVTTGKCYNELNEYFGPRLLEQL